MRRLAAWLLLLFPLCGFAQEDSLNITHLFHWEDTTLVASQAHDNTYNEIWGVVVNGREYAIIGSTAGTHFFDVTDPANAYEADFVPGAFQGPDVVHRDYHDYNGYLYMVCDEGPSTLQIVDLSYLPDSVELVYDSDALLKTSHNIFIDSSSAIMYAVAGVGMGNMVDLYDLANPENPELIIRCHADVDWWPGAIGKLHDIYVRDGIAYCNAELRGFFIIDFTTPTFPTMIGSVEQYTQQGYNHSGWLSPDGNVYVLADETHGMDLKLLDVSNPLNISLLDTIDPGSNPFQLPHNVLICHNYAFVSYYFDGLQIWDISDPTNAVRTGYYDTSTRSHANHKYEGCWGVYPYLPSGNVLVSDMQNGLWVLDVSAAAPECQHSVTVAEQPANTALTIWPNPTSDWVHIDGLQAGTNWQLLTLDGRVLDGGTLAWNTSLLLPASVRNGIYMLRLEFGGRAYMRKVAVTGR